MVPFWDFGGEEAGREGRVGPGGKQGGEKADYQRFKKKQHNTALFTAPCLLAERTLIPFKKSEFLSTNNA